MRLRNSLLILLFGGTLGLWLVREQQRGTLERFDRVHREFLKANPAGGQRAPALEQPAVVFVRLDDVDQPNRVFSAWPLADGDWQIILQNLSSYSPGAAAIAAPLPFDKSGGGLESAAKGVPGLCVAASVSASPGDGAASLPQALPVLTVSGSVREIPEFKSARLPAIPGGTAAGDIDLLARDKKLSVEGDWCRVPLLARLGNQVVPTLTLLALLEWADVPVPEVTVQPGVAITAGKSLRIEIDQGGFFRYFLSLAPPVPSVNADVFVLSREQAVASLAPGDPQRRVLAGLQKSLLWFGHDDAGSRLLHLPNGSPVSPAELAARAIAAIQTSSYMRPLPPPYQWIAPGATLLFCLWLTHWRKSRLLPGALATAVILGAVSLYLYHTGHWWMPLVPSLALLAATVVLSFLLPAPGWRDRPVPELPPSGKSTRAPAPARVTPARVKETTTQTAPAQAPAPPAEPPPEPESAPLPPAQRNKKGKRKRR